MNSRLFLVCKTFLDCRYAQGEKSHEAANYLLKNHRISPTLVAENRPYYRWYIFSHEAR